MVTGLKAMRTAQSRIPRQSVRSGFGQETFAGAAGNGQDAPIPFGHARWAPRTAPPARRGTDPERDEKFESHLLQRRVSSAKPDGRGGSGTAPVNSAIR